MSWMNEDGFPIDPPSLSAIPYEKRRDLHSKLVLHLVGMGWTNAQVAKFFNRSQDWVVEHVAAIESPEKVKKHCQVDSE